MDVHSRQQRPFPAVTIVALLLLLCIFPGQSLVTRLFPGIPELVTIRPGLVFLEIPLYLPVDIDLVLVSVLFFLIYPIVIVLYPSRPGMSYPRQAMQRVRAVFTGLLILLLCMLSGGWIYYMVQDYIPPQIRTGIGSFGINTDIYFPSPGYDTIHLRGSTVLLVFFLIGMAICIRKIKKEPGVPKATRLTREQRMTPYERMKQEKQVKEKQLAQQAALKKKGQKTDKSPQPNRNIPQPNRNDVPDLCFRQPVTTFRPEAVNYMPVS